MSEYAESKKLALLYILEILKKYSDAHHPLKQEKILRYLKDDYGIELERKAVGRNIKLLKDADYEIEQTAEGCYLNERLFEDAELHLLVDGVLAGKYVNAKHSKDLIQKLSDLGSPSYRDTTHKIAVADWDKTENKTLFYNIEVIDGAIERKRQIQYDYNKYGVDGKMHVSSHQTGSPYKLILHNQRYYLMSLNEKHKNILYTRVDRITNIELLDDMPSTDITTIPGYENGIDVKRFSTAMPYMYADKPERVVFMADVAIIDQVIDWFGNKILIEKTGDDTKCKVCVRVSLNAMKFWALQYCSSVEILTPQSLRDDVREKLANALDKYKNVPGTTDASQTP